MNEKIWHNIFKKYLEDYYAIHKLNKDGIIDIEHMHTLMIDINKLYFKGD